MKKFKVAIIIKDSNYNGKNLQNFDNGNPGVGGTQYLMALTAKLMNTTSEVDAYIFHIGDNLYSSPSQIFKSENEMLVYAENNNFDYVIFGPSFLINNYLYIRKSHLKYIYWAHNFINWNEMKLIEKLNNIRIVFVSKEQKDKYIDSKIYLKSYLIDNIIYDKHVNTKENLINNDDIVFLGGLIQYKGFHIIARIWKKIIMYNPNAKLHVIGSAGLYTDNYERGNFTPATKKYENKFIKYILKDNKILESIKFYGNLGACKKEILEKCSIGIFNPMCKEETFGLSILEMQKYGITVIAGKSSGSVELIKNNENGYILKCRFQLSKKIKYAMKNRNYDISNSAKKTYIKYTSEKQYIEKWKNLFNNFYIENIESNIDGVPSFIKFIKYFNFKIGLNKLISITDSILFIKYLVKKILRK